ncbi:MAG: hypothetical protein RDV48_03360 [Candidatus Eremiobacteraeota bacterium]|nr:hypothetical protein [Candidatus Eremiobacteraeota bacterium]
MTRYLCAIVILTLCLGLKAQAQDPSPPEPPGKLLLPQVLFKDEVVGKYIKKDSVYYLPLTLLAEKMDLKYSYDERKKVLTVLKKSCQTILLKKDDVEYIPLDDAKKVLEASITLNEGQKKIVVTPR